MGVEAVSGNSASVRSAIASASRATGIDFDYLLGQAQLESGLNPTARAGTSSATGLYQFIDQSWLGIIKRHGAEYGVSWAADAITRSASGKLGVPDPAMRRAVLALRDNPAIASAMAAESASDNKAALETTLGRGATGTDLYMAHFLGLGGATSFLRGLQSNPGQSAAALFPAAARANRSIFFAADGAPRSLADIYRRFAAKLDKGATAVGATGLASDALDGSGAPVPASSTSDFGTAKANFEQLAALTGLGDATVIGGSGETPGSAAAWARAALQRVNGTASATMPGRGAADLLRPTPDNARLAYMMLASLGT